MGRQGSVFPSGTGGFTGGTVANATTFSSGVTLSSTLTANGAVALNANTTLGASNFLIWSAGSKLSCGADASLRFDSNNAGTGMCLDWSAGAILFRTGANSAYMSCIAGDIQLNNRNVTAGTMANPLQGYIGSTLQKYTWTNAQVTALGAALTGDITVCTLPAKAIVVNAYVVILTAAGGPATLTVALGRTSAAYLDYIVASDAKATANTVYGKASAERGTNLTGYDMPSFTATTAVKCHFVATVSNLDQTTTCTGAVYLEVVIPPA